jgi:neurotransmitter:Na+ symporter, NSS family
LDKKKPIREGFSSGFAVFFATLGSAVGLGNIWKFPYLTGENGGAAFLIVYLLCVAFVGIPLMISEFYIGRKTRLNAVGSFEKLAPGKPWKLIGYMGVLGAYLIMFFYSSVAGWVYSYIFKAIRGDFVGITPEIAETKFAETLTSPYAPVIWQFLFLAIVGVVIVLGVRKGIERVTKTLMPLLFILIIICDIRALTLPGAKEGLAFLFAPDFSVIGPLTILTALGLAFFKLSIGMGTMITYSSYFTQNNNMINTATRVAVSDIIVSILAGIAIFPALFSFGMEPSAGPGLLFMTIPLVFSQMPFGNLLLIAFFTLTAIAATTASISIVETTVLFFSEQMKVPRKIAVAINISIMAIIGITASLSASSEGLLGGVKIFGKTFFDFFDFASSNILLPLGGLFIAIFIGYVIKKEDFVKELSNNGTIRNAGLIKALYFLLRYITPLLVILVFLNSLGII